MSRGERPLRSLARRLPTPMRQAAARGAHRLRLARSEVGVVVLLAGEPLAARRSLDSALAQSELPVEILAVVLDEELRPLATDRSRMAPRMRVLSFPQCPAGAAGLLAVRRLHASTALVLAPGDELLPGAAAALLSAREATGAAVVVGGLEGERPVHSPVENTDLVRRPEVARTPLLARLLVDRQRLLELPVQGGDPDGTVAAATLLAGGFAVAPTPTLRDVRPGTGRTLYHASPWPQLDRRIAADRASLELLDPFPDAARERVLGILDRGPLMFVNAVETATEAEWLRIVEHLRDASNADLGELDVQSRAAVWLALQGHRDALERFALDRRFADEGLPATVVAGEVRAVLPDLPEAVLTVHPTQSALRTQLTRLRRSGDLLELELYAGIWYVEQQLATATVQLVSDSASTVPERVSMDVEVFSDPAVTRWMGHREQGHDRGRLVARVPFAELASGRWQVEVSLVVGGYVDRVTRTGRVSEADDRGSAVRALSGPDRRTVRPQLRAGLVELVIEPGSSRPPARGVSDVEVGDGVVDVAVDTDTEGTAALVSGDVRITGVPLGRGRWRFRLETDRWHLGTAPAPVGDYGFELAGTLVVPVGEALLDRLPLETVTPTHRAAVRRGPDGGLVVRLDPPLKDDEAGPRAQTLLREGYAEVTEPVDPELVYFQSFTGQAASDHPLAVQQELRRRRPGTRMRWLVADSSSGVPDGAEPVQIRSREWYDVLARAGYVVTNIDLERWFRRRPGQEVLQTYHGYPSKRMGLEQWRARRLPESWIAQELARSSGTWTALLSPQTDAERYYREQYAYQGRVLSLGYPRDDALVAPGRERRRDEVRSRFGIGPTQRVLLYAPTWRDDLATDFRAAHVEHHLDLKALSQRLGGGWVVLLRGHRFHALAGDVPMPGVIDVTGYPDVNDLILAADAAVLDYSSLRFDLALTGRPAIYLAPDLDRYVGRVRGFLQDYRSTAPGPIVASTAEVVRELRSYDALVTRWRQPIADFNARFNARQDGHAAERVVEAFFGPLLEKP
ncbi:MAG: CDP-glycerol glycerophosphotransferase family protein [Marmoricola sp.]